MKGISKKLKFIYVFLIIGLESLGNLSAVTTVLEANLIKKNNWVTQEDIVDAVTVSRLGPGAMTANAVAYLGNKIAGVKGGIVAGICYTICPLIVIAIIYSFLGYLLEQSFFVSLFKGVIVYICALLVETTFKMSKDILKGKAKIIVFVGALILSCVTNVPYVLIIIGAACVGIIRAKLVGKCVCGVKEKGSA